MDEEGVLPEWAEGAEALLSAITDLPDVRWAYGDKVYTNSEPPDEDSVRVLLRPDEAFILFTVPSTQQIFHVSPPHRFPPQQYLDQIIACIQNQGYQCKGSITKPSQSVRPRTSYLAVMINAMLESPRQSPGEGQGGVPTMKISMPSKWVSEEAEELHEFIVEFPGVERVTVGNIKPALGEPDKYDIAISGTSLLASVVHGGRRQEFQVEREANVVLGGLWQELHQAIKEQFPVKPATQHPAIKSLFDPAPAEPTDGHGAKGAVPATGPVDHGGGTKPPAAKAPPASVPKPAATPPARKDITDLSAMSPPEFQAFVSRVFAEIKRRGWKVLEPEDAK